MLDIECYVVSLCYQDKDLDDEISNDEMYSVYRKFSDKTITGIIDHSLKNPICAVNKNSPLFETIGIFQKGLHRVAVTNERGEICNVLSQSDIVRFLVTKMDQYSHLFLKTAHELGLGKMKPQVCQADDKAIDAFKKLYDTKHSALAIVDDNGLLVGNLSASDLKVHN